MENNRDYIEDIKNFYERYLKHLKMDPKYKNSNLSSSNNVNKNIIRFEKILEFLNSDATYEYKKRVYDMYSSNDNEIEILSLELMKQVNGKQK